MSFLSFVLRQLVIASTCSTKKLPFHCFETVTNMADVTSYEDEAVLGPVYMEVGDPDRCGNI